MGESNTPKEPDVSGRTVPDAQGLAGASRSSQGGLDGTVRSDRPETSDTPSSLMMDGIRESHTQWALALSVLADPDCRICKGKGTSTGYIAPSKRAIYACPCTGQADWQR